MDMFGCMNHAESWPYGVQWDAMNWTFAKTVLFDKCFINRLLQILDESGIFWDVVI